jgi:hypothetical protein
VSRFRKVLLDRRSPLSAQPEDGGRTVRQSESRALPRCWQQESAAWIAAKPVAPDEASSNEQRIVVAARAVIRFTDFPVDV